MLNPSGVKIWRPRQLYLGETERSYLEVEQRQRKEGTSAFDAPVRVIHGGDSKRVKLATYRDERGNLIKPKL